MKRREKTYIIDTNVILRYLLDDHSTQSRRAAIFMADIYSGKIQAEIPAFVLAECVYVMDKYYQIPRAEIADKLKKLILFSGIVNSDKAILLNSLIKYEESGIDISDCLLAAQSSSDRVIVSFDNDIKALKAVYRKL
jgi:predicted nucleic-acid-binding protein